MSSPTFLKLAVSGLLAAACAGAGTADQKYKPTQASATAFEEPDLGPGEASMGYEPVVLTADDHRLSVPGANFGAAPPAKKAKKCKPTDPSCWPKSDAIKDQMEDLEWGMSIRRVFSIFEEKIKANFQAQMDAASGDLLAEDRIRTQMFRELDRVKNSYVTFEGTTTGYESHMVNTEFSHGNGESLMVWDAGKYVEYLFFINERFWKRVRLFRIDELGGITLNDFKGTLENLFGAKGQEIVTDEGEFDKIVWRDDETYAAILDGSNFFGVYGLRLSSAITETHLSKIRVNKARPSGAVSSDIEQTIERAVTSVDMNDNNESVVDSYTKGSSKPSSSSPKQQKSGSGGPSNQEIDSLF